MLISLVVMGGLSLMVRKFEREAPRPFDRLIVEVLPELPDLTGRPQELIERLELAHGNLHVGELQREALVELAYLYHANGFFSQAESCYLGLESFETENPRWPYLLGILKLDRQDQAVTATHFARAIRLDPTHSLAYLRLGNAYLKGGLLEEAETAFEYRLLGSPRDAWGRVAMGRVSIAREDWSAARDWLEQAKDQRPELGIVYDLLPEVYLETGDVEAAKSLRREGEALDLVYEMSDEHLLFLQDYCYDADLLLRFAREARSQTDFDRALELLQRAVALNLDNKDALAELEKLIVEIEGQPPN
ncbi:hypothetical protein IEN85_01260 [Pelagicoccus sp. NFK12]|uniref:Tetratricopeptide repeat protein n=1 Tax=Pelagicoccus enzymogenes TaxID=2773457 RepID=A0A927IDM0_9BACT|nr:tetratricopeptide repeat protein [Pelagicoccus enzymogenes]MBD5778122.1 hypothetical protein [Pelagicoccus enzymogenes]